MSNRVSTNRVSTNRMSSSRESSNRVSMAELNKRANAIINEVVETGDSVTVYKHGRAVAEISSIDEKKIGEDAIDYLLNNPPLSVTTPIDEVIAEGRNRGL